MHNGIFADLELPHRYELHDTKTIDDPDSQMLELIRSPTFGGAAVTMYVSSPGSRAADLTSSLRRPLKVAAMPHVDILSPDAKEIGSINTIIVDSICSSTGKSILLGRNTDWEGIRNPLLLALPEEKQKEELPLKGRWAFIIGGGGTTRAAVYALGKLGIQRIWLINRELKETEEIIRQFPQYVTRSSLPSVVLLARH